LVKDGSNLDQILKDLADMGYTSVEAANYNDGKFYGKTPQEFKQMVEKSGMTVLSSHTTHGLSDEELASGDFTEALKWWDQCIAAHKEAGMEYIVTPYLSVPKTLKDLQTYCDYYNEVGKRCQAAGLKYGYHNHAHEFQKVEDKELMLDYMLQHTNPEYVFFQMDVYWVVRGQNSPVDYFNKYPGRFTMLHIKDHREIGQSGVVTVFQTSSLAALAHFIVIVAVGLQVFQCLGNGEIRSHDILHTGLLMGSNALIPPFQGFRKVARSQFLVRQPVGSVRRKHGHTALFHHLFELLGSLAVELTVIVVGGLHTGIAHISQILQNLVEVTAVLHQVSYRIELDGYFLFRRFRRRFRAVAAAACGLSCPLAVAAPLPILLCCVRRTGRSILC
jgi:sugar phosphate isomerase/epimerase